MEITVYRPNQIGGCVTEIESRGVIAHTLHRRPQDAGTGKVSYGQRRDMAAECRRYEN